MFGGIGREGYGSVIWAVGIVERGRLGWGQESVTKQLESVRVSKAREGYGQWYMGQGWVVVVWWEGCGKDWAQRFIGGGQLGGAAGYGADRNTGRG